MFHCVEFAAVRLCKALGLCSIMECKARNPQSFAHLHRQIVHKIVVKEGKPHWPLLQVYFHCRTAGTCDLYPLYVGLASV